MSETPKTHIEDGYTFYELEKPEKAKNFFDKNKEKLPAIKKELFQEILKETNLSYDKKQEKYFYTLQGVTKEVNLEKIYLDIKNTDSTIENKDELYEKMRQTLYSNLDSFRGAYAMFQELEKNPNIQKGEAEKAMKNMHNIFGKISKYLRIGHIENEKENKFLYDRNLREIPDSFSSTPIGIETGKDANGNIQGVNLFPTEGKRAEALRGTMLKYLANEKNVKEDDILEYMEDFMKKTEFINTYFEDFDDSDLDNLIIKSYKLNYKEFRAKILQNPKYKQRVLDMEKVIAQNNFINKQLQKYLDTKYEDIEISIVKGRIDTKIYIDDLKSSEKSSYFTIPRYKIKPGTSGKNLTFEKIHSENLKYFFQIIDKDGITQPEEEFQKLVESVRNKKFKPPKILRRPSK